MSSQFPKRCSCGLVHTAEAWRELPFVGVQTYPWGERLELRNCACESTMAIQLDAAGADAE